MNVAAGGERGKGGRRGDKSTVALGHRPPPEEEEEDEEEEEPSFLRISAISPLSHCLSPPPHTPPLSRGEDRRIGKEMAELVPPCMAHKSICQNAEKNFCNVSR